MPEILTLANCLFTCPFLTGMITVQQLVPSITHNGAKVLTNMATLTGTGLCMKIPPTPTTPPPPCTLIMSPAWISGIEPAISANGLRILNSNASQICPLGTRISCQVILPAIHKKTAVPEMSVPDVEIPLDAADLLSSTFSPEDSPQTPENQQEQEDSSTGENTEDSPTEEAQNMDEQVKDILEEISDINEIPQNEENPEKSAKCDASSCPHRKECEYLKASSDLYPEEKKGASMILRENSSSLEQQYLARDLPIQEQARAKNPNIVWGNAAHHVISINAAFAQYKQLVKLAHFYGYDINSQENCIFLPSNREQGFGGQDILYKQTSAYEVMALTGLQWHVGQHTFSVNAEEYRYLPPNQRAKLKCYNHVLLEELQELLNDFLQRHPDCFYDDPETMQKKRNADDFINMMNGYAEKVRRHLLAFSKPKDSFPYFVSKEALNYAYNLPRTGKFICLIYHPDNHGWKLCLYHYERYAKNEYDIQLHEMGNYIADYRLQENLGELIAFCGNVRSFFIFDMYSRTKLPFQTECKTYYIHNEGGRYFIDTPSGTETTTIHQNDVNALRKLTSREIIEQIKPMFSAVLMHEQENSNLSPSEMIIKRKKECGML